MTPCANRGDLRWKARNTSAARTWRSTCSRSIVWYSKTSRATPRNTGRGSPTAPHRPSTRRRPAKTTPATDLDGDQIHGRPQPTIARTAARDATSHGEDGRRRTAKGRRPDRCTRAYPRTPPQPHLRSRRSKPPAYADGSGRGECAVLRSSTARDSPLVPPWGATKK